MAGVDNRIVTMKFDNAQFESGARTSLSTLEKLKQSMNFGTIGASASKALGGISGLFAKFGIKNPFATAEKGAADLSKAAGSVAAGGLTSMDGAITGVSNRFLAMSTIAITALSNITSKAMQTGQQLISSLTTDPIKGGLQEYETNLNSIQTILANTKVAGTGLPEVNAALDELNHYSDKTIYNFSEMARNIGTFTAAGVDLDTSVSSIKGIANLAALSGSNSQQAATAMYQLSQEIAAGRVSLMGWNSVVNAGMGGSTFQRALVQTAQQMGTLEGKTVEFTGKMKNATIDGQSFRDSIMAKPGEQSWLSKEVLTGTLSQFTGDMKDAELAAQGFDKAQIKAIQQMAKTATDAATKVKTLSGVLDTAKEVVGSGWAKTWQLVFGDFKEARKLFTNVSNTVNDFLGGMADARNNMLGDWKDLGGRTLIIEALGNAFDALKAVLAPIRDAFRDIFPAKTGQDLMDLTRSFVDFTKNLMISGETAENIQRTFRGVFAVFSIAGQVIGAIVGQIGRLFGAVGEGSGGFLDFTGGVGDALTALDRFLKRSGVIESFFNGLGNILSVPLKILGGIGDLLGSIFGGFDAGTASKVSGSIERFGQALSPLESAGERVAAVFEKISGVLATAAEYIGATLGTLGELIANSITPETFEAGLKVVNTTLLGGIVYMLRRLFTGNLSVDFTGGLFEGVKETLGEVTSALRVMQTQVKADLILKIAIALGVLTASILVLSMIDGKKLAKALAGMTAGFAGLGGALVWLAKAISFIGMAKLPVITAAMVALAGSILILSLALKVMSTISFADMIKGLLGLGGMLFIVQKAMGTMGKNAAGMIRAAAAMLILSVALNAMAVALKIFASMSWEEMARGLTGLAGALVAISGAMRLMPKGMVLQAAALLVLSGALNAIAVAMKIFASMGLADIARGLGALTGSLAAIAATMRMMPKTLPITAAGLVLVAVALNGIAAALKIMGGSSMGEIAKGLVLLGGALLILSVGLNSMGPMAIVGAAALTAATAALMLLTPVLITLGTLDWMTIIKSLTMLAGVFVILGLAGYILAPLTPVLISLGAAMVLIGAGLALAGAGALAFATAFGAIVAAGAGGVQILGQMLGTIVDSIPGFFAALGKGLVSFANQIAKSGPTFMRAMGAILGAMLDSVIKNVPKMGRAFLAMLNTALRVVVQATPRIVAAGLKLIVGFLSAIEQNIGRIVDLASRIIVNFIDGIARNIGRIIQSGVNLIIKFINGVATAIENNSAEMGEAGGRLAVAMVNGMASGIRGGAGVISDAAMSAARAAWDEVKAFFKVGSPSKLLRDDLGRWIPIGMALGIRDEERAPADAIEKMGQTTMSKLNRTMAAVEEGFAMSADLSPVISPVLDLTALTQEANKMSSILATAPIMAGVSYQTAADISAMTQPSSDAGDGPDDPSTGGGGDHTTNLTLELHSPKPIDSVESYRAGKTLISLAKEALK